MISAQGRQSTPAKRCRSYFCMAQKDRTTTTTEGLFIGDALHRLAVELDAPNPRQLALRLGIDYKHFHNLWTNARAAGLPTVVKLSRNAGKSFAYFAGDVSAKPLIGSIDANGKVHLVSVSPTNALSGLIALMDAADPFPAGAQLHVEPGPYGAERWLIVRTGEAGDVWVAWAIELGGLKLLQRLGGERIIYSVAHHQVLGVVQSITIPPPAPRAPPRGELKYLPDADKK